MHVLSLLLSAVVAVAATFCPTGNGRDPASVVKVAADLNEAFSSDRPKILGDFLAESSVSLLSNQTYLILTSYGFSSELNDAVTQMTPWIVGLSCNETALLLSVAGFSATKLDLLGTLVDLIYDSDDENARQDIFDQFPFSSDKATAKQILDDASPLSCTWGPISEKKIVFVVDVSGSMSTTFEDSTGKRWSRLGYVMTELDRVIQEQLPKIQGRMFNVLTFSSFVREWQHGLRETSPENLASISKWIATQTGGGSTYTNNALKAAYGMADVEAVYLLSDGMPSDASPAAIISNAKQLSNDGKIPCTTIFMGLPTPDASAGPFMENLAAATKGYFRPITQV